MRKEHNVLFMSRYGTRARAAGGLLLYLRNGSDCRLHFPFSSTAAAVTLIQVCVHVHVHVHVHVRVVGYAAHVVPQGHHSHHVTVVIAGVRCFRWFESSGVRVHFYLFFGCKWQVFGISDFAGDVVGCRSTNTGLAELC